MKKKLLTEITIVYTRDAWTNTTKLLDNEELDLDVRSELALIEIKLWEILYNLRDKNIKYKIKDIENICEEVKELDFRRWKLSYFNIK